MKRIAIAGIAGILTLGLVGVGTAEAFASAGHAKGALSAAPQAPAKKMSGAGWQPLVSFSMPAGYSSLFFHYACPGKLVAASGEFSISASDPSANTIKLIGQGVRFDIAGLHEYFWSFNWPGTVSPSGGTIGFSVHCVKK
jgi:hypothetical protein